MQTLYLDLPLLHGGPYDRQLAKSSPPLTVADHTNQGPTEVRYLAERRPLMFRRYQEITGLDLAQLSWQTFRCHDLGKIATWFQAALRKNGIPERRHELESLRMITESNWPQGHVVCGPDIPDEMFVAIADSHAKLTLAHEHRFDGNYRPLWTRAMTIHRRAQRIVENADDPLAEAVRQRHRFDTARAVQWRVDYRASAKARGQAPPEIATFSQLKVYAQPRGLQKRVDEFWDQPLMLLRGPCGSGKTGTVSLVADMLYRAGMIDGVAILLPSRMTATAMVRALGGGLDLIGLVHSTAVLANQHRIGEGDPCDLRAYQELARAGETPWLISTIDPAALSMTNRRPWHSQLFNSLSRKLVVFDEAHFYNAWTQGVMRLLIKALLLQGARVCVMSATLPQSMADYYTEGFAEHGLAVPKVISDQEGADEKKWRIQCAGDCSSPDDVADRIDQGLDAGSLIIYANTTESARAWARWVRARIAARPELKGMPVAVYHSKFMATERLRRENRILDMLGEDAWKCGEARGVAIMTQVGEMSINISAECMISELCPADSLTQRMGRAGRFWGDKVPHIVDVHVVRPIRKNRSYPAPYGDFSTVTYQWSENAAYARTNDLLASGGFSANDLVDLVEGVYNERVRESPAVRQNVQAFRDDLEGNIVVRPVDSFSDDSGPSVRDIAPEAMVYVTTAGDRSFDSYLDWMDFEMECGIGVPLWQYLAAGPKLESFRVTVGAGKNQRVMEKKRVADGVYSAEDGLFLKDAEAA